MNDRAFECELQIEILDVVADDAVKIWTECFHAEQKLRHDDSLITVERLLSGIPADHATLDLAARKLINEVDAEKAAEVAIQSSLEVVLVK